MYREVDRDGEGVSLVEDIHNIAESCCEALLDMLGAKSLENQCVVSSTG